MTKSSTNPWKKAGGDTPTTKPTIIKKPKKYVKPYDGENEGPKVPL